MTYYAQMARSYAIETMFAVIATYLLLRAWPDGRWRWWLGYAAAVALTGLFNIFGLLILAAHGVTLLLTDARGQAAQGRRVGRIPLRWLAVCSAAVIVLAPLLGLASRQQVQIAWLSPAHVQGDRAAAHRPRGLPAADPPVRAARAGRPVRRLPGGQLAAAQPAAIALPWLVVPPFVLIAASYVKPVYYVRYVEFCLPALAILAGAGLTGLIRLAAVTPLARWTRPAAPRPRCPGRAGRRGARRAAGRAAAGDQEDRRPPDNLRLASAIVAANEQPGDVVFYIPATMHVLGTGYPAPFGRLRDIALNKSAIASGTLTGTEITNPALLKSRFTDVRRVWVVTGASTYKFPVPSTPADKEKMALLAGAGMHILHRWQAREVMLTLYGT